MSKIVIIDDDLSIRNFCHALFTGEGHEVITFPRGDQAIDILEQEQVDLVITDLEMPGESGLSIVKKIQSINTRLPVVIFSGFVTDTIEKEAYEAGAVGVIRKGTDPSELRDKINRILIAKQRIFEESPTPRIIKMLIVDDEEQERNLLRDCFTDKGLRVSTAGSGEEALTIASREKPNIVLLDIVLPGMDGMLALKKLLELDQNLGVIMMTGFQDDKLTQEALSLGAYHYVLKPFELSYLERVVQVRLVYPQ